jgi:hypothetical protein
MDEPTADAAAPPGAADADRAGGQAPAVDLAQLADKVYRLLREELRLDRARGAAATPRERR